MLFQNVGPSSNFESYWSDGYYPLSTVVTRFSRGSENEIFLSRRTTARMAASTRSYNNDIPRPIICNTVLALYTNIFHIMTRYSFSRNDFVLHSSLNCKLEAWSRVQRTRSTTRKFGLTFAVFNLCFILLPVQLRIALPYFPNMNACCFLFVNLSG